MGFKHHLRLELKKEPAQFDLSQIKGIIMLQFPDRNVKVFKVQESTERIRWNQ